MTNETALDKALKLNEKLCAIRAATPPSVCSIHPCEQRKAVAAELKRAWADGIDKAFTSGYSSMTWRLAGEARKEADQLEGKQ